MERKISFILSIVNIIFFFFYLNGEEISQSNYEQKLIKDEKTVILLHFDGNFDDESGIKPERVRGIEFVTGKFNQGVLIKDNDDILVYNNGENDFNEGSIELWIKLNWNAWENDRSRIILDFYDKVGYRNRIRLYFYSTKGVPGSFLFFDILDTSGKHFVSQYRKSNQWEANVWHHLAIFWKRNEGIKFYVDGKIEGVRVGENKELSNWNLDLSGKKIFIGIDGSGAYPGALDGVIDEVRISNICRTSVK